MRAKGCVRAEPYQAFAEGLAVLAARICDKGRRPTMVLSDQVVAVPVRASHLFQTPKCERAASRVLRVDEGPDQLRQRIDDARLLWSQILLRLRQSGGQVQHRLRTTHNRAHTGDSGSGASLPMHDATHVRALRTMAAAKSPSVLDRPLQNGK